MGFRLVLLLFLPTLGGCRTSGAGKGGHRHQAEAPVQLVLEHDAPSTVHTMTGDSLVIRGTLRNAGATPVRLVFGERLFIAIAEGPYTAAQTAGEIPLAHSWGSPRVLEYPHPGAPYLGAITLFTLAPGAEYPMWRTLADSPFPLRYQAATSCGSARR